MELKEFRKINELNVWEKNPRTISKDSYQRLKKRIQRFGQFKPIIINKENIVVGGNMRFRVLQELKVEDVWVSVVDASTEAKMLEYALVDNESAGKWDEMQLAELLQEDWVDLGDRDYVIDRKKINIEKLLDEYGPGDELEELGKLEGEEEKVKCPKCGHEFTVLIQKNQLK